MRAAFVCVVVLAIFTSAQATGRTRRDVMASSFEYFSRSAMSPATRYSLYL